MDPLQKNTMTAELVIIILLIGLFAGILSGLVGVGGGLIIVPALIFFLGFNQHQAQGTSLGLLLLPVGILAVINYYNKLSSFPGCLILNLIISSKLKSLLEIILNP